MLKDIYKRLNLETDLTREQEKFIKRIRETLKEMNSFFDYYKQKDLLTEMTFKLGEESHNFFETYLIPYSFKRTLFVSEIFLNILKERKEADYFLYFYKKIKEAIDLSVIDLGIHFEDGKFYLKGAEELDQKFILEPLEWLKDFPTTKEFFKETLQEYLRKDYPDAITKSYSALETLVKTFLNNNKSLKDNITELIKKLDFPKQWGQMVFYFCEFANEFSSRHGKKEKVKTTELDPELVEAYIYFTGLLLRLIIQKMKTK